MSKIDPHPPTKKAFSTLAAKLKDDEVRDLGYCFGHCFAFIFERFEFDFVYGTFIAKNFNVAVKVTLSILLFSLYIAFVIVFTCIGYSNDQSGSYVSFDPTSGSCNQKPYEITNSYELDLNGIWDSSKSYKQSKSIMTYHFERFSKTTDQYANFIVKMQHAVNSTTRLIRF